MKQSDAHIRLNMIVRDEAHVIERCLASVRHWISSWCIVDTGSKDDTPARIEKALAGIPGCLHHRPWRDFGHNRSEAIELARKIPATANYLFFIDADEVLVMPQNFSWPTLHEDAYALSVHYGDFEYDRTCLVNLRTPWRWQGVLHEYLDAGRPITTQRIVGPYIWSRPEGARSNNPHKYEHDAEMLKRALQDEPDNARYVFYLAQSLRDCGRLEESRQYYQQRMKMPGWDEETWYAAFENARLSIRLEDTPENILHAGLHAYQLRPSRAEPLVVLATWCRERQQWALARMFAKTATEIPFPADRLFVDASIWRWRARDELALALFYTGALIEAGRIWQDMLAGTDLPEEQRPRIIQNLGYVSDAK